MQVNILLFGQIAEIIGTNNLTIQNITDTNELVHELQLLYPSLNNTKYAMAVEKQLIKENTLLQNNNTVALLPPFSGG